MQRPIVLAAALVLTATVAQAQDLSKYPDWSGEWSRIGNGSFDSSKPRLAQQAPLIPEYQAILKESLADQAKGGEGNDTSARCIPTGMPRMMIPIQPMEIVVTPDVTYVLTEHFNQFRHIYTDGRDWPERIEPSFAGYSIGHWLEENGRYQTLVLETRGFKGPRTYDSTGAELHRDNQSVIRERLSLDPSNPDVLHNEITVMDHALTHPWTVNRGYQRSRNPSWLEYPCANGDNPDIFVGNQHYMQSVDGYLMPTGKDQPPPDLRYFNQK